MENEQAQSESITVYPTDRAIIEGVMLKHGMTFSAAIRYIVREWQSLTAEQQANKQAKPKSKKAQ